MCGWGKERKRQTRQDSCQNFSDTRRTKWRNRSRNSRRSQSPEEIFWLNREHWSLLVHFFSFLATLGVEREPSGSSATCNTLSRVDYLHDGKPGSLNKNLDASRGDQSWKLFLVTKRGSSLSFFLLTTPFFASYQTLWITCIHRPSEYSSSSSNPPDAFRCCGIHALSSTPSPPTSYKPLWNQVEPQWLPSEQKGPSCPDWRASPSSLCSLLLWRRVRCSNNGEQRQQRHGLQKWTQMVVWFLTMK